MNKKTILVTAGLSDYKLKTKIIGLIENEGIERIILVRKYKFECTDKISIVLPPRAIKNIGILFELWRLIKIIKLTRSLRVDAIIGIQLIAHGISASIAAKLTNTHCTICPIGKDIHSYINKFIYSYAVTWSLKQANKIAYMGPKSKEILLKQNIPEKKLVELKNYHDPNLFKNYKNFEHCIWDFIYIGQLIKRKNINLIIHAFKKIIDLYPNIKLAIVGDGPEHYNLLELCKSLSITKNIYFLGFRKDINELLNSSRIFILVSEIEALPASALEAMHCGIPSILTNICDIPGIFIHEFNSLLVPPNNINAIADAMKRLHEDQQLYLKLHDGCKFSRTKYQLDWCLENQEITWNKLLNNDLPLS